MLVEIFGAHGGLTTSHGWREECMDAVFKEVKVEKVSDKIVNQLIELITEGQLVPGEKLPGERKLTELFGVGRSSLREALSTLETLGFIEIKKRQGNYVRNVDKVVLSNPLKKIIEGDQRRIVELYEVRRSIEQSSAREAAKNRTEKDLENIHNALLRLKNPPGESSFSWQKEVAFHLSIARASHNFLRLHTLKAIFDFSQEFLEPILCDYTSSRGRVATVFQQHSEIFEAIRIQDSALAWRLMREHLVGTNKRFTVYFAEGQAGIQNLR